MLRLTPEAQGEHLAQLPSRWVNLGVLYPTANDGSVEVQADLRWKTYDFIIWSWSKQWKILLVVISKSCLWIWIVVTAYWGGLKLRKLVINDCVYVFLELFRGMAEGWCAVEMACTYLEGFLLGGWNTENWGGWPSKEEFLHNSSGTLHVWRSDRNC